MVWRQGQAWRVVGSLQQLNAQLREHAPRAVPPATPATAWGSIADAEHSQDSDHYPHVIAALGSVAVVTARDFPHAPHLGLDLGKLAETWRLSRDPRIKYVIFNRRMFSSYATSSYPAFTWRPYGGTDPHDTHGHVSSVSTAAADDARPWAMPGSGEEPSMMSWTQPLTQGPPGIVGQPRDNALAYAWQHAHVAAAAATEAVALLRAIAQRVDIDAAELAAIGRAAEEGSRRANAEMAAGIAQAVTAELRAELDEHGIITEQGIERAMRRVFQDAGTADGSGL